jgi:nicotinamide-nucleotide amidase
MIEVIDLNVAILAIGNEVLCGKIVDTNGAIISREIARVGAKVVHREVVLDTVEDIVLGLIHAYEYADLVITIGGLGPTVDDLTRVGVAQYFNEKLVYDDGIYQRIARVFASMDQEMPENNKRQAYRFAEGRVIDNPNGTAPGLFLEKDGHLVFLLPGPPNEMFPMFDKHVLPIIKGMVEMPLITRSYRLYGIGESPAEEKIIHLYEKYPMLDIAPYCSISYIDYVVSGPEFNVAHLDSFEKDFLEILNEHHVGSAEVNLNERVVAMLKGMNLTLAVAESCTGGMLAATLIDVPGVSEVLLEGLVVYSNEAKKTRLGISPEILEEYGAVSMETAREMAFKLACQTGADVTVSVTGIAGPGGGTHAKPVGTVYIGISIDSNIQVVKCHFSGSRDKVRERSMNQALYLLFRRLSDRLK